MPVSHSVSVVSAPGDNIQIAARRPAMLKIIVASFSGTTLEYYDFFIYGTMAALVFKQLFFPSYSPLVGTLAAFATFAVGFFSRPLGSVLFGYWGDKLGRRRTLIISLLLMGASTVAIGLLPTFGSIGVFAPILLVALRLLQGLAMGGEWGGAALMLVENSPPERKGLIGSAVQMGAPGGLILASGVTTISGWVSGSEFLIWGWRIPFLASLVLLLIAFWIRMGIDETREFEALQASQKKMEPKVPIVDVFRRNWKDLFLAFGMAAPSNSVFYIATIYTLSYSSSHLGMSRGTVLNALLLASTIPLITIPMFGWISDRVGHWRMVAFGSLSSFVSSFLYFHMLDRASMGWTLGAMAILLAINHASLQAPQAALFSSRFDVSVRYTGISLSQSIPTTIIGGTIPFLATLLFSLSGGTTLIAAYMAALGVFGFVCAWLCAPRRVASSRE
ncbi:MFS transporter [Paraburkholderia sp. GAS334]|uniref:MFS transporter n=1 Tax=Paraburkholderia sp. GAS334 TaxID=3035131 RepID=UPI003D246871